MIELEDIENALASAEGNMPPNASLESYDHNCEQLKVLLDRCIRERVHLSHPAVVERVKEVDDNERRVKRHERLSRCKDIFTVGELEALIADLPKDMPLICTGEAGNRQGLRLHSNRYAYTTKPGQVCDVHEQVYAARIYGIPEVEWQKNRIPEVL